MVCYLTFALPVPSLPASIFLIDHAWTFRPEAVGGLLASVPGLAARMAALVDVWGVPDVGGGGGSEGEEGEEDLYDSTSTSKSIWP